MVALAEWPGDAFRLVLGSSCESLPANWSPDASARSFWLWLVSRDSLVLQSSVSTTHAILNLKKFTLIQSSTLLLHHVTSRVLHDRLIPNYKEGLAYIAAKPDT